MKKLLLLFVIMFTSLEISAQQNDTISSDKTTYWIATLKAYRDSGNFVSATTAFYCFDEFPSKQMMETLFIRDIKSSNPSLKKKVFTTVEILFLMRVTQKEFYLFIKEK